MEIRFKTLQLTNFKAHINLTLDYEKDTTFLKGPNGIGKTTIGDAVSYLTHGCDLSGSDMTKDLSPEPVGYEGDTHAELVFTADGESRSIAKRIEKGTIQYYINGVPKKATEYKEYIDEMFGNKQTFLSLYSSRYFFTQKWEEQRETIMSNILPPAKAEILERMQEIEAAALDEQLMKQNLDDTESMFKDKHKRSKKDSQDMKERVSTLSGVLRADSKHRSVEVIQKDIQEVIAAIDGTEKPETSRIDELRKLKAENLVAASSLKRESETKRKEFDNLRMKEPGKTCDHCGQDIEGEAYKTAFANWRNRLVALKEHVNDLTSQRGKLFEEAVEFSEELTVLEENTKVPTEYNDLLVKRAELNAELKEAERFESLKKQLEDAEIKEEEANKTFRLSVLILDAVKNYRAIEAELMAEKASALFSDDITLKLFTVNKTDGKQKPHFEIMKKGKPFRKLSLGEKMGVELEIVEVLSEKILGHSYPCFIDNSESYTGEINADGKQLIVSRVQKESELN